MIRISEEQKVILNCYSVTKEEITAQLRAVIPHIEDSELKAMSESLLKILPVISEGELMALRESVLIAKAPDEGQIDDS